MEVNMDEKWKLSKKGSRKASSGEGNNGAFFKRSASTREARVPNTMPRSFSSRCSGLVKEQRAKFYIMRRCVTMLICWRDYP